MTRAASNLPWSTRGLGGTKAGNSHRRRAVSGESLHACIIRQSAFAVPTDESDGEYRTAIGRRSADRLSAQENR